MRSGCLLTDAGTAGVLRIAGNMLTISLSLSLLLAPLLHFHPLVSHQRLTRRCVGIIASYSQYPLIRSLFPFTCWLSLNPLSTPLVAPPLAVFIPPSYLHLSPPPCWAASSHILALLINNPTARSQHSAFLAARCSLSHFSFEEDVRRRFFIRSRFHSAPSLARRDLPAYHFFLSTYNISSSLTHLQFSVESHLLHTSLITKELRGHPIFLSWRGISK